VRSGKANHVYLPGFSSSVSLEAETVTLRVLAASSSTEKIQIKPSLPWLAWLFSKKKKLLKPSRLYSTSMFLFQFLLHAEAPVLHADVVAR
jgi:hypothetical protein